MEGQLAFYFSGYSNNTALSKKNHHDLRMNMPKANCFAFCFSVHLAVIRGTASRGGCDLGIQNLTGVMTQPDQEILQSVDSLINFPIGQAF